MTGDLRTSDLKNLALVCRSWSDTASQAVWREVQDIFPLLHLLPTNAVHLVSVILRKLSFTLLTV